MNKNFQILQGFIFAVSIHCVDISTSHTFNMDSTVIKSGTFRLMGGDTVSEGRVEVYHDDTWGTVCGKWKWKITEADMVCRSMGFYGAVDSPTRVHKRYGPGPGKIWLSGVDCEYGVSSLDNCTHDAWGIPKSECTPFEDVGVVCSDCQTELDNRFRLHCKSCSINGFGTCDQSECPAIPTFYNSSTQQCQLLLNSANYYECEEYHQLEWSITSSKYRDSVSSMLECAYLCVIDTDFICSGTVYDILNKQCLMYTENKYTVPGKKYIPSSRHHHCSIGFCKPGYEMSKNKTCCECPINRYKIHYGSPCMPCNVGYDTSGVTGSKECKKTCAAGSYSREGVYCETCPEDTYKNLNDGSSCLRCKKHTTTGGKIGQTQCKSQFQHIMNEYGFYYIGVLSGFLAVGSCFGNIFKKSLKKLYLKFKDDLNYEESKFTSALSSTIIRIAENEEIIINSVGAKTYKITQFQNNENHIHTDINVTTVEETEIY